MASINRRGKYWRVQIRRQGYPYLSATFDTKAEATAWAFKKEAELDRQTPAEVCQRLEARQYRLADALLRYEMDVLPDKKPTTRKRELGIMADLKVTFGDLALVGKRLSNPLLRVGADQATAVFFQFQGKSSWSRLLGQVGSFSSTSQRYAKGSTPFSLHVSMML